MSDCFITRRGFNKTNSNLLLLLQNGETVNGLTGFTFLNHANDSGAKKSKGEDGYIGLIEPFYYTMYKANSYDSNNPDSLIMSTNEKIDLTNYNYIMFSFFSSTNYGYGNYSDFGGGYFRIDEPKNLPVVNTPYNWDGWDTVFTLNQVINLFIKDISDIKGRHNLCFGICHGKDNPSYINYFSINNLILV